MADARLTQAAAAYCENAQMMKFTWLDTREVRSSEPTRYVILNDSDRPISPSVLDTMRSYGGRSSEYEVTQRIDAVTGSSVPGRFV